MLLFAILAVHSPSHLDNTDGVSEMNRLRVRFTHSEVIFKPSVSFLLLIPVSSAVINSYFE